MHLMFGLIVAWAGAMLWCLSIRYDEGNPRYAAAWLIACSVWFICGALITGGEG